MNEEKGAKENLLRRNLIERDLARGLLEPYPRGRGLETRGGTARSHGYYSPGQAVENTMITRVSICGKVAAFLAGKGMAIMGTILPSGGPGTRIPTSASN